jgi:hypothetical protein
MLDVYLFIPQCHTQMRLPTLTPAGHMSMSDAGVRNMFLFETPERDDKHNSETEKKKMPDIQRHMGTGIQR